MNKKMKDLKEKETVVSPSLICPGYYAKFHLGVVVEWMGFDSSDLFTF